MERVPPVFQFIVVALRMRMCHGFVAFLAGTSICLRLQIGITFMFLIDSLQLIVVALLLIFMALRSV